MTTWTPPTREQIITALFTKIQTVMGTSIRTYTRRLKLWDQVPKEQRPYLALVEHREDYTPTPRGIDSRNLLHCMVYIYIDAHDQTVIGGSVINNLLDTLDGVFSGLSGVGVETLGGLVNRVWINGPVFKDPGDLDGDGLAIVPIQILIP
jgi:hypothetical protein